MASIKGISLRGIKNFTGTDGYGIEASIYLDGKRVGRLFDGAFGGEADIDFTDSAVEKEVQKRVDSFFAEHPYEFAGMDSFLYILSDLAEVEKVYKREAKKGREILVTKCLFDYSTAVSGCLSFAKEHPLVQDGNALLKHCSERLGLDKMMVYYSLDGFVIK